MSPTDTAALRNHIRNNLGDHTISDLVVLALLDALDAARAKAIPEDARERIARALLSAHAAEFSVKSDPPPHEVDRAHRYSDAVLAALAPHAHDLTGPGNSCRRCGAS